MAEVRVRITDDLGGNETIAKTTSSEVGTGQIASNSVSAKVSNNKAKMNAVALMLGKQTVSYATSNIGKWTGDSHNQVIVNNVNDLVGIGMMAVVNPFIALASTAFRIGTTAIDYSYESRLNRLESERKLARGGFSSSGEAIGFRRGNR